MHMIFVSIIGSLCRSLFQQQCTMSRADEGAAFTCSWRDRLTGRETLWGNKGVPKTKEGHNQSQIPLRTSLPPIGAESPGVQVALSTNSVSVSRSNSSDQSPHTYGNLWTVKVGNELTNAYCLQRKEECFYDQSTQVFHRPKHPSAPKAVCHARFFARSGLTICWSS